MPTAKELRRAALEATAARLPADGLPGRRINMSDVLWLLLTKPTRDHSSVTLSRNAKGETQIEVVVRTGESDEVATIFDAERVAGEVFTRLRTAYPMSSGAVGA